MDSERKLMQFHFITKAEVSAHYHQNPELFYILRGKMEVKIDDAVFLMKPGDIILINANKQHLMSAQSDDVLGARVEIDFHLLAEHMGTMQLFFWCNTVADKNEAYQDLRSLLDRILARYFEKDDKGALYLNALYYETLYVLTSNFLIKTDDVRARYDDSQDSIRIRQIQNYIQANYQTQISLNDLADRLYLSNAYLSKYIKKNMGLTFMEYLNNVRLFHAVDELLYTKKNITHIALDNGFPTSAAFTKAFRDMYREAPSEYRKKAQNQQEITDYTQALTQEERQHVMEYLKFREHKEAPEAKNSRQCTVDVKEIKEKLSACCKAVSLGDAYSILQSEVQSQVKEIQRETGLKYIRIWNLLSRENCFNEKEGYNFHKLDLVLDFLIENQMKPYLELGHKPTLFMYTPERSVKEVETTPGIYKIDVFQDIITALCLHLVNRYGVDEIETWYFEYWNAPQLKIEDEDGEYYLYFETIYRTLKEISPAIKVGGAGFILGYETLLCKDIFQIWKKRDIHPDFLSFCSFQYVAMIESGIRYGRKSIDCSYMKNQVDIMKKVMEEAGFVPGEFHIDEWNFTISNRNVLNDSCEQGAYILKNFIDMNGSVDFMAYWHALDLYSDYYDTDSILNGDSGMISRDGIRKPSFYALSFMNRLLHNVLKRDENSIVTTNSRDRYVIACHNFKRLSSRYVFTEEDGIKIEELDDYMEDTDSIKLNFTLDNVKNGRYLVKIYYVNKENGSAQDIWKQMEYTKGLARDEIEYLKKSAIPCIEMKTIQVDDGVLEIENVLKAQEIRLLDIQYRYHM